MPCCTVWPRCYSSDKLIINSGLRYQSSASTARFTWGKLINYNVSQKVCHTSNGYNCQFLINSQKYFAAAKSYKFPTKPIISLPTTPYVCCCITLGNLKPLVWTHAWRHYRQCNWPVEKASPGMSVHVVDVWAPFVNKLIQTISIFTCFWFKWHLPMVSDVYCVDTWWWLGLPCLTAKL